LTSLSDKIQLEILNFAIDRDKAEMFKIRRVPAIALVRMESEIVGGAVQLRERDFGIRYYGVPAGYEFSALVSDVFDVSRGESGLSEASKTLLAQLQEPLHLQVFTTPT
jgi:hypothetical protein